MSPTRRGIPKSAHFHARVCVCLSRYCFFLSLFRSPRQVSCFPEQRVEEKRYVREVDEENLITITEELLLLLLLFFFFILSIVSYY